MPDLALRCRRRVLCHGVRPRIEMSLVSTVFFWLVQHGQYVTILASIGTCAVFLQRETGRISHGLDLLGMETLDVVLLAHLELGDIRAGDRARLWLFIGRGDHEIAGAIGPLCELKSLIPTATMRLWCNVFTSTRPQSCSYYQVLEYTFVVRVLISISDVETKLQEHGADTSRSLLMLFDHRLRRAVGNTLCSRIP